MKNVPARVTIRTLAQKLHLSRTTVSDALRNHPRVNSKTRELVQAKAREAGYRFNPLASTLLSEIRRARLTSFQGVLATVNLEEADRVPFQGTYWQDLRQGACQRAEQLGFKIEHFVVGDHGVSVPRLEKILVASGIRGVLIMPTWHKPDFTRLTWKDYTGVYADYLIDRPALHSVCPDHPRAMGMALERLNELGYRRPGLVLLEQESSRIEHRWLGAFLGYLNRHPEMKPIKPLMLQSLQESVFASWLKKEKPDVVLSSRAQIMEWVAALGVHVPEELGFCCLNIRLSNYPCAGLDQQPALVGARAIESVIAQIHHNTYGLPEIPCNTTVPARWVDGPTLKRRTRA